MQQNISYFLVAVASSYDRPTSLLGLNYTVTTIIKSITEITQRIMTVLTYGNSGFEGPIPSIMCIFFPTTVANPFREIQSRREMVSSQRSAAARAVSRERKYFYNQNKLRYLSYADALSRLCRNINVAEAKLAIDTRTRAAAM